MYHLPILHKYIIFLSIVNFLKINFKKIVSLFELTNLSDAITVSTYITVFGTFRVAIVWKIDCVT